MEIKDDNIIIHNIEDYNINIKNGDLILIKKSETKIDLTKYDFKKSKILFFKINNKKLNINKYKIIYKYLYEYINKKDFIIKNTLLNIKDGEYNSEGFQYISKLNFSVQGVDANKAIKEIFNISKLANIKIKLKIKLENSSIINL